MSSSRASDSSLKTTGKLVFAVLLVTVANDVVPVTLPVNGPAKASDVTVPSKKAFLNSNEDVPRSISLSVTGMRAPSTNFI